MSMDLQTTFRRFTIASAFWPSRLFMLAVTAEKEDDEEEAFLSISSAAALILTALSQKTVKSIQSVTLK